MRQHFCVILLIFNLVECGLRQLLQLLGIAMFLSFKLDDDAQQGGSSGSKQDVIAAITEFTGLGGVGIAKQYAQTEEQSSDRSPIR